MDPLGLAFENFNALGRWRDKEQGQPIDASGQAGHGREFASIQELKQILVDRPSARFLSLPEREAAHLCSGRGLEYDDVETVDRLVERLEQQERHAAALLMGIVESVPFQRRRRQAAEVRERPGHGESHGARISGGSVDAEDRAGDHRRRRSSRRHFLRGLGVCVALPAFESLSQAKPLAAATEARALARTASGAPLRTAFIFFPNGAIPKPGGPRARVRTSSSGTPSSRSEPIEGLVQVLGGLNHRTAEGGPDGAGDHARGNGTFLTGVRLKKSATDIRAGVSIDQVIARRIGHLTRFPSLELACDSGRKSGACDSGYSCAYQYNLSWSSPTTPMPPETNPRLVFERLFGSGSPGQRQANLERRRHRADDRPRLRPGRRPSMQRRLNHTTRTSSTST